METKEPIWETAKTVSPQIPEMNVGRKRPTDTEIVKMADIGWICEFNGLDKCFYFKRADYREVGFDYWALIKDLSPVIKEVNCGNGRAPTESEIKMFKSLGWVPYNKPNGLPGCFYFRREGEI